MPPWHHKPFDRRNLISKNLTQEISIADEKKSLFISQGQNKFGPFTIKEVKEMIEKGIVKHNDAIWREGWPTWKSLYSIQELNRRKV